MAGLTTLACLLLASQVFTAYMVFNQKQQIHTIQKNNEKLGKQLTRSSQGKTDTEMLTIRHGGTRRNMSLMRDRDHLTVRGGCKEEEVEREVRVVFKEPDLKA